MVAEVSPQANPPAPSQLWRGPGLHVRVLSSRGDGAGVLAVRPEAIRSQRSAKGAVSVGLVQGGAEHLTRVATLSEGSGLGRGAAP